mmetsp:Transcript_18988/g.60462  ORF Transcript_18988/g.60462 Transcript_18988/m.60462 type:complete len:260 (-) Transcript_18988:39-818(-)
MRFQDRSPSPPQAQATPHPMQESRPCHQAPTPPPLAPALPPPLAPELQPRRPVHASFLVGLAWHRRPTQPHPHSRPLIAPGSFLQACSSHLPAPPMRGPGAAGDRRHDSPREGLGPPPKAATQCLRPAPANLAAPLWPAPLKRLMPPRCVAPLATAAPAPTCTASPVAALTRSWCTHVARQQGAQVGPRCQRSRSAPQAAIGVTGHAQTQQRKAAPAAAGCGCRRGSRPAVAPPVEVQPAPTQSEARSQSPTPPPEQPL